MPYDLWSYRPQLVEVAEPVTLTGYDVEATDGRIGSVGEATNEVGSSLIVVDTGRWVFDRKMMLPAGTIARIDHVERKVYVDRDKDAIRNAPKYDEQFRADPDYRVRLGDYYGRAGM